MLFCRHISDRVASRPSDRRLLVLRRQSNIMITRTMIEWSPPPVQQSAYVRPVLTPDNAGGEATADDIPSDYANCGDSFGKELPGSDEEARTPEGGALSHEAHDSLQNDTGDGEEFMFTALNASFDSQHLAALDAAFTLDDDDDDPLAYPVDKAPQDIAVQRLRLMSEFQKLAVRNSDNLGNSNADEGCREDEADRAAGREVLLADTHRYMREHVHCPEVQAEAGEALLAMVTAAESAADAAAQLELVLDVQRAMQAHGGHAGVQLQACKILGNLVHKNSALRQKVGELGILADIQAAMKCHAHLGSPALQAQASEAVSWITHESSENKAEAERLGLLADVQRAMLTHAASGTLQTTACDAIWQMTAGSDEARNQAAQLGLMEDVCDAMAAHKSCARVQTCACRAISALAATHEANTFDACCLGALPLIHAAMAAHPSDADVQQAACSAVLAMMLDEHYQAEAWRAGLLASVQSALRAFPACPRVQDAGCGVVWQMTKAVSYVRADAARLGLLEDMQRAIRLPNQHAGIGNASSDCPEGVAGGRQHDACAVVAACNAVAGLSIYPQNGCAAAKLDLLSDIQRAMREYPDSKDVQAAACAAVTCMTMERADGKAAAGRLHLLGELREAMRTHRDSAMVQTQACTALEAIIIGSDPNWENALRLRLKDDVVLAMVSHVDVRSMTIQASHALFALKYGIPEPSSALFRSASCAAQLSASRRKRFAGSSSMQ